MFALPERQEIATLQLNAGATVAEAIEASSLVRLFPDEDIQQCAAGIWGNPVPRSHLLQDGDRVELYRPLQLDPREARRKLAAEGKSLGQSGAQQERKRKN